MRQFVTFVSLLNHYAYSRMPHLAAMFTSTFVDRLSSP